MNEPTHNTILRSDWTYQPADSAQPTPTELALIAGPLTWGAAVFDPEDAVAKAYLLWLSARAFCEERKGK